MSILIRSTYLLLGPLPYNQTERRTNERFSKRVRQCKRKNPSRSKQQYTINQNKMSLLILIIAVVVLVSILNSDHEQERREEEEEDSSTLAEERVGILIRFPHNQK